MDGKLKAQNNLIRTGEVVSTNPAAGTCRVQFADADSLVSFDMQVLFGRTHRDKHYNMPDIGDQVVCAFLASGLETGFVLGCAYNGKDKPPVSSQDKDHITYEDGTVIEYDRAEHVLKADVKGRAEITTTEGIKAEAGTTIEATAGESATITAPVLNINAVLKVQGQGGGGTTATLNGNFNINGDVSIDGNLNTNGNSYAASRTGGVPPH